ncbi:hypothetical protein NDI52_07220 [Leptolyngbya sp. PL-A3]|uniref:hypothetical protein n=1 Tax=Leptolyngbya sp. PL-A3 TaxID=2933911 RepID=UPI003299ABC1
MSSQSAITFWGLSIADLTALLIMGLTLITTVANILLWLSTRQTVQLLVGQVQHQIKSTYTDAKHQLVEAHRDIFFGILNNPTLLEHFARTNGLDPKEWELEKVSAFLINQVMISFLRFQTGIINRTHFEGFKRDARDVFLYSTVRSHWEKVRLLHSEEFRLFVETEILLPDPVPTANS